MTPDELKSIRRDTLGLTLEQLARALGYTGTHARMTVNKMESGAKPITPPVERLIIAYRDGYRPRDWPS